MARAPYKTVAYRSSLGEFISVQIAAERLGLSVSDFARQFVRAGVAQVLNKQHEGAEAQCQAMDNATLGSPA